MQTLTNPGDVVRRTVNGISIQIQMTVEGAYVRTVMAGPAVVDALSKGYTDQRKALAEANHLREGLKTGTSVWQFAADQQAAETGVLATADDILDGALQVACAAPVTEQADREIAHLQQYKPADPSDLAARINADLDAQQAARRAEADALNADIAEIMANSRGFRSDRKPATLAQAVPAPAEARQVRPTMAGAHLAPLSIPQKRAIDANRCGVVVPGDGITPATLNALARKGYGQLRYDGRRKRITALDLNSRAIARAQSETTFV